MQPSTFIWAEHSHSYKSRLTFMLRHEIMKLRELNETQASQSQMFPLTFKQLCDSQFVYFKSILFLFICKN